MQWARVVLGACILLAVVCLAAIVIALRERAAADVADEVATARRLAFASRALLDSWPERALLLTLEACRRACDRAPGESYEVRDSLLRSLQHAARLKDVLRLDGEPRAVALSRDGRRLAVTTYTEATERGSLVVFDLDDRRASRTALPSSNDQLVFTPDGRRIVTEGFGTVRFFDAQRLTPTESPLVLQANATIDGSPFSDDVGSVHLSSDGTVASVRGTHGVFNVWDLRQRRPARKFPQSRFDGGLLSPDGKRLAAYRGNAITMWDLQRGRKIGTIPFATSVLSFSADGRTAALGARGGVRLWDVTRNESRGRLLRGPQTIDSLVYDPTGKRLAGSSEGAAWVWNLERPATRARRASAGYPVAFGPAGRTLMISSDRELVLLDAKTRDRIVAAPLLKGWTVTAYTRDERVLVSANGDGTLRIWDLTHANPLVRTRIHSVDDPYRTTALAWSPDGGVLASGGFDGSVVLTPIAQPDQARPLVVRENPIELVAFSPNGQTLALLAATHDVELWNIGAAELRGTISVPATTSAAFTDDGRTLAVLDVDGGVRFWDPGDEAFQSLRYRLFEGAEMLAIAPNGATVAASDFDGNVYVWSVRDRRVGQRTLIHRAVAGEYVPMLYSLAFSSDGSVLLASAADDQVRLFDVARALPLGEPFPVDGGAALSPRDATLASAQKGGIAIWDGVLLSTDSRAWERRICRITGGPLSRSDWQRFLPDEAYHPACRQAR